MAESISTESISTTQEDANSMMTEDVIVIDDIFSKSIPEIMLEFNPLSIIEQTAYVPKLNEDEEEVKKQIKNLLKTEIHYTNTSEVLSDFYLYLQSFGIKINKLDFEDYCELTQFELHLNREINNDTINLLNSDDTRLETIRKIINNTEIINLGEPIDSDNIELTNYIENLKQKIQNGNNLIRFNRGYYDQIKYITPVNKINCTINSSFNMYINYHIQCGTLDYDNDDDTDYTQLEIDIKNLINKILLKGKEQIINNIVKKYLKVDSTVKLKTLYTQYIIFCLYVYFKSFIFRYESSDDFFKAFLRQAIPNDHKPLFLTYRSNYYDDENKKHRVSNKITQELLQIIFNVNPKENLNKMCIYRNSNKVEFLLSSIAELEKNKKKISKKAKEYTNPKFGFVKLYKKGHAYLRFEKYSKDCEDFAEFYIIDDKPGAVTQLNEDQKACTITEGLSYFERNGFKKLERLSKDFWIVLNPNYVKKTDDKVILNMIQNFSKDTVVKEGTDVFLKLNGGDVNKYIAMIIGLIIFIVIVVCIVIVIIKYKNKDDVNSTKS